MPMRGDSFPVDLVRGVPVVRVPAEIDVTNTAGLRAALLEASQGAAAFVVDMTRTTFCDSAGIHALIDAYKQARAEGAEVLLAMSGEAVPRIFALTGVDQVIPSYPGLDEALRHTPAGTGPIPLPDLAAGLGAGLAEHAAVDGDQGRLLLRAEAFVRADRVLGRRGLGDVVSLVGADLARRHLVDQAGLGHQRLRGQVERVGDLLEHAHRRLVQAALDLAEVRVREVGQLRELAQRQVGHPALGPDEGAERLPLGLPRVLHGHLLIPAKYSTRQHSGRCRVLIWLVACWLVTCRPLTGWPFTCWPCPRRGPGP